MNGKCGASPNTVANIASWLFELGTKSGMPKYSAMLGLIQASVLFLPELFLEKLGVNAQTFLAISPTFVQYYIINTDFKNAMSLFWILSPFTFCICTYLYVLHANTRGYPAYLVRRAARLKKVGKPQDYSLSIGMAAAVILYVWSTAIYQTEPTIFNGFTPARNRLAMLVIHAGSLGLFLPCALAVLITDIRANITRRVTK